MPQFFNDLTKIYEVYRVSTPHTLCTSANVRGEDGYHEGVHRF